MKNYDTREFYTQLLAMEATLKKLSEHAFENKDFQTILSSFLTKGKTAIASVRSKFEKFTDAWLECLKYFGEDPADYINVLVENGKRGGPDEKRKQPTYVFVSLDLFFQAFKDAVSQYREEEERQRQRQIRASLRAKRKSAVESPSSDVVGQSPSVSSLDNASDRGSSLFNSQEMSSRKEIPSLPDLKSGDSTQTICKESSVASGSQFSVIFESTEEFDPNLVQSGKIEDEAIKEKMDTQRRKSKVLQRISRQFMDFSIQKEVDIDTESRQDTEQLLAEAAVGMQPIDEENPSLVMRRYSRLNTLHPVGNLSGLKNSISVEGLVEESPKKGDSDQWLDICEVCQMEHTACECDP